MIKTILYFHGFASSSESDKAKIFRKYISSLNKEIKVIIPDLSNNFKDAVDEINQFIKLNKKPIAFLGSSLGGYYAAYFSKKLNAILLVSSLLSNAINFPSSGKASEIESALSPVKVPISSTFLVFETFIIKCKK